MLTHRFQLVLLAALVLFVALPAGPDSVRPVTAVAVTHEASSRPARDSAQPERAKPRQRSVAPSVAPPSSTVAPLAGTTATFPNAARPPISVGTSVVKPSQRVARVLSPHEAFSKPTRASALLALVRPRRPLTGARTVLPILGARIGPHGIGWLRVRLPGRPNGATGWIRQRGTLASTTSWHIRVDTSRRRVTVYRSGRPVRSVKGVVGNSSTPTPHGKFFVEEAIQLRAFDVGAPYALALSARSNVLQSFNGGPGQIAFHGLANVGGVLGTAVSHGCVRLGNDTMRWLVHRIGPGVPVTIAG